MKYIASLLLVVISVSLRGQSQLTTAELLGQLNTITTAVPFLLITPDARAGGIGDAGCASSPDVYSNYWNASKNVFAEKKNGVSVSYTPWLRALVPDVNLYDLSLYKKIRRKNVVGFSGRCFSLGDITLTTITGSVIGQFRPYEYTGSIFFARQIKNNFSIGILGKYIFSNLTGGITIVGGTIHAGKSFAMDISCYKRDTIKAKDIFTWGVNISNVGQKISYVDTGGSKDFLPANLRIGVSYKINFTKHHSVAIICDANKLLVPTPPAYDTSGNIIAGKDPNRTVGNALYSSFYDAPGGYREELREINIASGIEYWYHKLLAIRTGYFYEHTTKGGRKYLTFGIGGRYAGLGLDISYLLPTEKRHPLQNTMRFTLLYEFGKYNQSAHM